MKNIFQYIKKYKDKSFEEKEINNIDYLIFTSLSYVPFYHIFLEKTEDFTIQELSNLYFNNITKKNNEKNILAIRKSIEIFKQIGNSKRYGNLIVYNYVRIANEYTQFCALSLKLNKNTVFVSFEGTDELIISWKEDFQMAHQFPISAQKYAIDYLKKYFKYKKVNLIVGGHSKGGNLALVSAMYSNYFIRKKIKKIFNYDGPGLRKKQIESRNYKKIEDKLINIIPNYSFIGLLLRHKKNQLIVESYEKSILAHDFTNWKINDDEFVYTELSYVSRKFSVASLIWLEKYDDKEREEFVNALFDVCTRAKINDLLDIKSEKIKCIFEIIKEIKNIDEKTSNMLKDFFKFMFKYYTSEIKLSIGNKFKKIVEKNS